MSPHSISSPILEEDLRESASIGDAERLSTLLSSGVDVNARHALNGWTALHWAAHRGYPTICKFLLQHGADPKIKNLKGEAPGKLTERPDILRMLGEPETRDAAATSSASAAAAAAASEKQPPSLIPNQHRDRPDDRFPVAALSRLALESGVAHRPPPPPRSTVHPYPPYPSNPPYPGYNPDELVVKVRIEGHPDPDFIEVELPRGPGLDFELLLDVLSEELGVPKNLISKVRKRPDTILRKDRDLLRLRDFEELEVVVSQTPCVNSPSSGGRYLPRYGSVDARILY